MEIARRAVKTSFYGVVRKIIWKTMDMFVTRFSVPKLKVEKPDCNINCRISNSVSNEEWYLLGCYAVWLLLDPAFRRNLAPPSSG
jgi:hypothetical protein